MALSLISQHSAWAQETVSNEITLERTSPRIIDIRLIGNFVTKPAILLQEMVVKQGDVIDFNKIETSRQAIMDLKLFKAVKADILPTKGGAILQITVEEKFYVLPIPKLNRDGDGDIKFGGELRLDNINGQNQQLEFSWDRKKFADSDINDRDQIDIDYTYPRIRGTPYQFDLDVQQETTQEDVLSDTGDPASYDRLGRSARLALSRWAGRKGPSRGWRYGGGFSWVATDHKLITGPDDLLTDSEIVTLNVELSFIDIHDRLYSRNGSNYGYGGAYGIRALGSDENFNLQTLFYRGYFSPFDEPHKNINIQIRLGFSNRDSEESFSLGSSSTLRGYERDSFSGNALFLTNIEYLAPLFGYSQIRGLVFTDFGNTYERVGKIDLTDLKASVGLGLRWKLKSFVKTDLRIDVAYAVETGSTKTIVTTREMF